MVEEIGERQKELRHPPVEGGGVEEGDGTAGHAGQPCLQSAGCQGGCG